MSTRHEEAAKELARERELTHGLGVALNIAKKSGNASEAAWHAETAAALRYENGILRETLAHYRELEDAAAAARDALLKYGEWYGPCLLCHKDDMDTGNPFQAEADSIDEKVNSALDALNKALGGTP